jgi:hypothetical protein
MPKRYEGFDTWKGGKKWREDSRDCPA